MASVGSSSVLVMRGRPRDAGIAVESFERLGRDGAETRQIGYRERIASIYTAATAADATAAETLAATYRALQGTSVTITDADGIEHADCLVLDVDATIRAVATPTNEPTDTRLVEARWSVRKSV